MVNASELMIIVNYLKDAGAEAISVNGQRVVNMNYFVEIGQENSYIKMRGKRISAPFEIKVIGDAEYLKSTLIGIGYVDKINGWGQKINFEEKKKITIDKYKDEMNFKYIEN